MKIGLPNALLYYRYGALWKSFFERLGCGVIVSDRTNRRTMAEGIGRSAGECCLPVKIYLGHVAGLLGRCDRILVPRFERLGRDDEFCVRFWGLPDIVRGTFPEARLLTYNLNNKGIGGELPGFLSMGRELGVSRADSLCAYGAAREAQRVEDIRAQITQRRVLRRPGLKVLVASHPYVVHDPFMGGPLVRMIRERGAAPVFADRCERAACSRLSRELSNDLYWAMNKEAIGAIPLLGKRIDGVILVTAFPCGTDSLVNELVLRRVRDIPVTHIVLDEHQGEAGLQTRIECFLDILEERRPRHAS